MTSTVHCHSPDQKSLLFVSVGTSWRASVEQQDAFCQYALCLIFTYIYASKPITYYIHLHIFIYTYTSTYTNTHGSHCRIGVRDPQAETVQRFRSEAEDSYKHIHTCAGI